MMARGSRDRPETDLANEFARTGVNHEKAPGRMARGSIDNAGCGGPQPMSLRPSFQLLRDFQSHPGCRLKSAPRGAPWPTLARHALRNVNQRAVSTGNRP